MLVTVLMIVIVTSLMIACNSLYVAGEFAAVSARKTRIAQMASEGNRLAKTLLPVLEDHHKLDNYIAASQVGITLSSVVLGIYGQQQIAVHLAPVLADLPFLSAVAAAGVSATLVLVLLTTLQVILGELVPKSLALQYPERLALATAIPMRWSADVFLRPLIVVLNGSGTLLMRVLGIHRGEGHSHVHSPEEIKYLISQSHEGGLLDEQEHHLLDSALRFGNVRVGEIVKPRTKIVAADIEMSVDDILRLAAKSNFTRIPIYDRNMDNIIGFVHLKELFQLSYKVAATDVRPILRDVSFVPETAYLDDVWTILNVKKSYLAIVFDEYGGSVGLVTREDLLEELFGEVQDEFDQSEITPIEKIGENTYQVRGDVSIASLNDRFSLSIHSHDVFTIGGFFLNQLGHMPGVGDEIVVENVRLQAKVVEGWTVEAIILTIEQAHQHNEDWG